MNATRENPRCCYAEHVCSRTRFENYKFCFEHMLEDDNSPFTTCEYISRTSNRKCPNPALRQRKSDDLPVLCNDHFKDLIAKERHHKQKKRIRKKKKSEKRLSEQQMRKERKALINHVLKRGNGLPSSSRRSHTIDSSDSDEYEEVHRPITDDWPLENLEDLKNDADWDDFDPVNNEVYEPLRYADVLTPEEVVATAQSKLIRLQSLYIEQFKRLFYLLKERRRDYLHELKKEEKEEKSGKAGNSNMESDPHRHQRMKALFNYRKRKGVEILLRRKQIKKRMESGSGSSNYSPEQTASQPRCAHASNHARCKSFCLPYTKYCSEHILEDPHQLLYRKCCVNSCPVVVCHLTSRSYKEEKAEGDAEKKNPAGQSEEKCYCILHAPLPEMTFNMPKEILRGYEPKVKMEVDASVDANQQTEMEQDVDTLNMELDGEPSESNMQTRENPSSICIPVATEDQSATSEELNSVPVLPQKTKENLVDVTEESVISIVSHVPNISTSNQVKLDAGDTKLEQEVTNMDVDEDQSEEHADDSKVIKNTDASDQGGISVTNTKESIAEKNCEELEENKQSLSHTPLIKEEKLEAEAHSEPLCTVDGENKPEDPGNIPPNLNDTNSVVKEVLTVSNISKTTEDCQSAENTDSQEDQDKSESKTSNLEGDGIPNTNNNSSKGAKAESDIILEESSDKINANDELANINLKTVQEKTEEKIEGKVPEESNSVLAGGSPENRDMELEKEKSEDVTEQSTLTALTPTHEQPRQITSRMGKRKPSSADEELAVVSLLSLCSASHHSDENFSSSAEQD